MSSPLESPEFGKLYVGDTRDDDGPVIDSLVQEVDRPAAPVVESISPAPLIEPPRMTRVLANTEVMYIGDQPRRLMPADPTRQTCRVRVYSLNDTPANITRQDYVIVADELGKVSNGVSGICVVIRHNSSADFDGHTGALWVYPSQLLTAFIEITSWGVAK
jgi:hypothetical protein